MANVRELIEGCPALHRFETELDAATAKTMLGVAEGQGQLYRPEPSLIDFLIATVEPHHRTIETGCGVSTIVFAALGQQHLCVTPNHEETEALGTYLKNNGLDAKRFTSINGDSVDVLPTLRDVFDVALIDGKHAFPWPTIDWFYMSDRLVTHGLVVLDDIDLGNIKYLDRFLAHDSNWRAVSRGRRWSAYQKINNIRNSVWHAQPFQKPDRAKDFVKRIIGSRATAAVSSALSRLTHQK